MWYHLEISDSKRNEGLGSSGFELLNMDGIYNNCPIVFSTEMVLKERQRMKYAKLLEEK